MIFSPDPRFWFAIARDMAWAARRPQPVLKPREVPCPCDCGMTMGEVKELP
jgi:hypothetical protein